MNTLFEHDQVLHCWLALTLGCVPVLCLWKAVAQGLSTNTIPIFTLASGWDLGNFHATY